ncbi:hypothetical protein LXN10_02065 [Arcobacter sp. KX21116]|uniref:hypothetical protein n=1 Tax=Arcobacter iocasae TaxID=2906515 RepID=UPI0035D4F29B
MNFKITNDAILKRKFKPIYPIAFTTILLFLIVFSAIQQKEKIDWLQVIIFSCIILIVAGSSIFGAYKDIKEMRQLTIEVKDEGVYLYALVGISILPFEMIKSVNLKYKNNEIKKFIVKSNQGRIDDYSGFENLNELNSELKKHLDKELWK